MTNTAGVRTQSTCTVLPATIRYTAVVTASYVAIFSVSSVFDCAVYIHSIPVKTMLVLVVLVVCLVVLGCCENEDREGG